MENYNETIIDAQEVEDYSQHLRPGTLLQKGKYQIVRFIKSGGFGCTYEAVNTTWKDRRVAIKELYVDDFCDRDHDRVTISTKSKKPLFEKLRNKFWDEANRINQLTHPGVVRVTDVFEENDTVYYVMDYIEGESLRDLIETKGRLPEAKVLYYMRQICEALQYVHDNKLMHLDIKPGNIMIDHAGDRAILIDFGVSRQYDEVGSANTSTLVPYTEGYAPIEQMGQNVRELGAATDIYAVGATLYHMLSGAVPPSASKLASGDALPPLPTTVSERTRRAIVAAMNVKKQERPQSVTDFLSHFEGKRVHPGSTGEPRKNHRWLWLAVVGVLIGVGVVFGLRGCGDHQGEAVPVADATEVVIDSAATSTTLPALTEEVLSEAMQKGQEQAERLAALEQENQRLKEQRRQDSIAAVKKAEDERKAADERNKREDEKKKDQPASNINNQWENLITLVYVPGGTFTMGATSEQGGEGSSDESPTHRVTVSGFYMGKTEVTQAQWKAVMGSNPSYFKGDNLPVENVSYNDAQSFCRELSRLTGKTYRLPTEAEWEYAARGGKSEGCKFSGSHSIDRVAWYDGNSGSSTHPVGQKTANELGLHDMSGNVWEWCSDYYDSSYYSISPQNNPKGPGSGSGRVLRGGSWYYDASHCRVSYRSNFSPSSRSYSHGFRVVCVP